MFLTQAPETVSMLTRHGLRLDADVYRPPEKGPFPALLMRQPYGRTIASTIVYAHPQWYASQGYIVVIQDVRGRGTSAGEFDLFAHEAEDGEDTIQWVAQLPGCDGQVGMYGFSYQGMTQLQAAQTKPSALKTIAPAMTGYYLYEDWAYENGAFCLQIGLTWALQLAAETARRQGDAQAYRKLLAAAKQLPLFDPVPACPEVLAGTDSFFHDWVTKSATHDYWRSLTPQLDEVDLPMLHIGGWFDPYLRGDLRLYQEMTAQSKRQRHQHYLCVGPWGHIPWGRKVGEVDFGPQAMSPIDQLQIDWFDHILKGRDWLENRPVKLFEMGRNQWRQLADWPKNGLIQTYFLQSDGLANIREDSGFLSAQCSAHFLDEPRCDRLVHDPWNPAPALGGHSAIPAGSFERTAVDSRGDVLTYTSAPMEAEMRVVGVVEMVGAIASSTPSYDLCAVLSKVTGGKVFNLTQGYCRVEMADAEPIITLPLQPTCFSLAPGESLRLSLSAACFPAYPVNPGSGVALHEAKLIEAQIIRIAIAIGGTSGAKLRLPIVH
ncbi:MAG: S15 family X-Pro dipeptidyl-peptidase [Phormidesmis priestleyi]|uniref:S15 family X-Pro dipeptidyl-peptidase n=1 Tax=Phormidesmis priestleyi TaxID=268141 RepID=A0A2W4XS52_9CYAN|nr:MAG: S15 family X-Pro dipeptidyl-peptidase [Phormidesmis priestleyi]